MNNLKNIETDFEFYCYIKKNLPKNYSIIAEPSPDYYAEWYFHYKLFKNGRLLNEYKGDFRKIKKGSLEQQAGNLMNKLKNKNVDRK